MANVEAGPETSVFRSWGSLRRVWNGDGNRIIYPVPKSEFPVEPDVFHPNGVNGAGANADLLTGEGIL